MGAEILKGKIMATFEDFLETMTRLDFERTHLVKKTAEVFAQLSPGDKKGAHHAR